MPRLPQLTQWQAHLASRFPDLPASAVAVLALYSFGMLLAQVSGLSHVSLLLSAFLGVSFHSLRKRLSEFYKEAPAKSGAAQGHKRRDFDPSACFAPLLRWVLLLWSGKHLPLAIDVTNLGERFHVLCVSVVVRGIGIPVAWRVLPGGVKDPWNPHWLALLGKLKAAVPADWTVAVLSDRGLESPELFAAVVGLGWHPLMRVKKGGKFRPRGWGEFRCMGELVTEVGGSFNAQGHAYAGERMAATLLACWSEGHEEPWLVLTDLPPEASSAVWYSLRTWIEQGFKVIKGGGWHWQNTRMEDCGRVERLWLVMAVATLWVVALGAEEEVKEQAAAEQRRQQREMSESLEQARQRQQRERARLEKQREALDARQAEKQRRQAEKEAREEQRREQRAAKRKGQTKEAKPAEAKPAEAKPAEAKPAEAKPAEAKPAEAKPAEAKPAEAKGKAGGGKPRLHRTFTRGLAILRAAWHQGGNRLPKHLHPEPWPQPCHPHAPLTEQEFLSRKT